MANDAAWISLGKWQNKCLLPFAHFKKKKKTKKNQWINSPCSYVQWAMAQWPAPIMWSQATRIKNRRPCAPTCDCGSAQAGAANHKTTATWFHCLGPRVTWVGVTPPGGEGFVAKRGDLGFGPQKARPNSALLLVRRSPREHTHTSLLPKVTWEPYQPPALLT